MCISRPKIQASPPPPPVQAPQLPDTLAAQRTKRKTGGGGFGNGTALTGPSGVAAGSLNTGGATVLGG